MSRNGDFNVGGGRWSGERIDERIIVTPGREIIEETITRGPYRERYEETIISGPRREIIEERVVVGPRREIIEERVIIDRPNDSYYRRHEPPPPYSVSCQMSLPFNVPKPFKPLVSKPVAPSILTATFSPSKILMQARQARQPSVQPTSYSAKSSVYGWVPPSHCMGTLSWYPCSGNRIPSDAVHAGTDKDGSTIYAGRASHEGDILPAKVVPSHGCAYVSWGGNEIRKDFFDVLCSRHVAWQFGENGHVPVEAIACGHTSGGERLYMGRRMHDGTLTVGKVHPSHHCIYIPYAGREISYRDYEVLVLS